MGKLCDLLTPAKWVSSLAEVDIDQLMEMGIDSIILDLDNTILPWRDYDIPERSVDWVSQAAKRGMKICIASNTNNPARLKSVAKRLGIVGYDRIAKPRRKGLVAAMAAMETVPERTAIIGDQIFTDILGGNRLSIYTILVEPMHRREFIGTKISRMFEKPILACLARRGVIGTKKPRRESENQD